MASATSNTVDAEPGGADVHLPDTARDLVKILITGPFGVGKTTLIRSVSEIRPLHTEERLSEASARVDDLAGVRDKSTTTVAIDFGRISLPGGIVLYLFGTPGQERFRALWEVEESGLPYAVAFNTFPDAPRHHTPEQLRAALDLEPTTPMVACDARETNSSVDALLALVQHLIDHHPPEPR
ncbi:ATP/GTP-binding protein [Streptomyces sp. NPDC046832]|uniref:GTP-binding protein n=1 Tax=Streptomyces sp. NPDC046832 TaxID=3155020 RepID=UPI003407DF26